MMIIIIKLTYRTHRFYNKIMYVKNFEHWKPYINAMCFYHLEFNSWISWSEHCSNWHISTDGTGLWKQVSLSLGKPLSLLKLAMKIKQLVYVGPVWVIWTNNRSLHPWELQCSNKVKQQRWTNVKQSEHISKHLQKTIPSNLWTQML